MHLPARLARLTRARRRWFGRRTARVLLADFWYFWSHKSTIKEKLLYDTYLSEFFSLVRKERKGQKEESVPLLISFCRLAATSANILPRPSRYSIATATGSKRSSADSDLLLCHVRLWRTSRFKLGRMSGCEHGEIGFISVVPSAYKLSPRPPCTYSGRADNACTNLLGSLVRYVRTRGIAEIVEVAKLPTFALPPCRTHLPRMARATNSCTRKVFFKREESPLK